MKNPRVTKKEQDLIKGALRRVFARSELRNKVINLTLVPNHKDSSRPRVKHWCFCPSCKSFKARSEMVVDHLDPVVGIRETVYQLEPTDIVDRLWCLEHNLQPLCKDPCHKAKTKEENKARRQYKKEKNHV